MGGAPLGAPPANGASGLKPASQSGYKPARAEATHVVTVTDGDGAVTKLPIAAGVQPTFPADGSVVLTLGEGSGLLTAVLHSAGDGDAAGRMRRALAGAGACGNHFDDKTDAASSDMYFHYYGMLQHQQNMLQDATRTGTYYWAMLKNTCDFQGKVVIDVGAGTGILSLFAAQAGARKVYAIEASGMTQYAQKLFDANAARGGDRIQLLAGKVEALAADAVPQRADVLISEPMGTLLVNERMLETYIYARKHLLAPGGKMFPSVGKIHVAAFSDAALYAELAGMSAFWTNGTFYGVDLRSVHADATTGYFGKVVIDAFDPGLLVSTHAQHVIDFTTADEADLADIVIPLHLVCNGPHVVHGVACWFDVLFPGAEQAMWLSTAPGMPTTHWYQLRCVVQAPLHVQGDGQAVTGTLRLTAHRGQSYDVQLDLHASPLPDEADSQTASGSFDLKDPYYRQMRSNWFAPAEGA